MIHAFRETIERSTGVSTLWSWNGMPCGDQIQSRHFQPPSSASRQPYREPDHPRVEMARKPVDYALYLVTGRDLLPPGKVCRDVWKFMAES